MKAVGDERLVGHPLSLAGMCLRLQLKMWGYLASIVLKFESLIKKSKTSRKVPFNIQPMENKANNVKFLTQSQALHTLNKWSLSGGCPLRMDKAVLVYTYEVILC